MAAALGNSNAIFPAKKVDIRFLFGSAGLLSMDDIMPGLLVSPACSSRSSKPSFGCSAMLGDKLNARVGFAGDLLTRIRVLPDGVMYAFLYILSSDLYFLTGDCEMEPFSLTKGVEVDVSDMSETESSSMLRHSC